MKKHLVSARIFLWIIVLSGLIIFSSLQGSTFAQSVNPDPPQEIVKLIFIHHSTGENWLSDGNGDLGLSLSNNNYFVSDTNYGWGPNSIGDATDYFNWPEWFVGPDSSLYLDALYNENGQNSPYTRTLADPGGENRIIMFKSCFPNSDLGGNPNDQPSDGEWNTVGHAKFVYNELLTYFKTRPDKLFIAITPPPLLDPTHAENAREFSRWMVEDWLAENDYPLNNVAVWDFHNVLTHTDNHHRIKGGSIEHTFSNGNGTLQYDSDGDEHPNGVGNRKSTAEFVPMLNTFYNSWIANAPLTPPETEDQPPQDTSEDSTIEEPPQEAASPTLYLQGNTIDDFESGNPLGTNGWEPFWDEATQSSLSCGADSNLFKSGSNSLRIDFHIEPDGWGTCPLFFDNPPGFLNSHGVSFDYHASSQSLIFNFDALTGRPGDSQTYYFAVETVPSSVDGWVHIEITWDLILGVEWEANSGVPVTSSEVIGFAYGFTTYTDAPNTGTIWIDNLSIITGETFTQPEPAEPSQPEETEQEEPVSPSDESEEVDDEVADTDDEEGSEPESGPNLCPGSTTMVGLTILAAAFYQGKYNQRVRQRD